MYEVRLQDFGLFFPISISILYFITDSKHYTGSVIRNNKKAAAATEAPSCGEKQMAQFSLSCHTRNAWLHNNNPRHSVFTLAREGKKYPTHLSKGIICRKMYAPV